MGTGLGYVFPYLSKDLQQEIFEKAEGNGQFAIGLGHGFGSIYSHLEEDVQNEYVVEQTIMVISQRA